MATIKKLTPNLWFNSEAEEAAKYYTSIFRDSRIDEVVYYPNAGIEVHKKKPGSVMTVEFTLAGQPFVALNGGPDFKFSEAISFIVDCEDQGEVDYFWNKLSQGGDPAAQQCGWLKDKFGLSWQIVPKALPRLLQDPDKEKVERTFEAMLKMKKLDVDALEAASEPSVKQ